MQLSASIIAIDRLLKFLESQIDDHRQNGTVTEEILYIIRLVPDELKSKTMLSLTYAEAQTFNEEKPFGENVSIKFPSLIYEINEGTKCLALGRSTASAFHSIRCLEGGIRAISRCLKIPDPTKG
jgi:hypothetical protein